MTLASQDHLSSRLVWFTADDGAAIPVQITGQGGPPLVLLHEWTGEHGLWRAFLRPLAQRFTIYAWDARGHGGQGQGQGQEGAGGGAATVDRMARDLAQMIDHFGLVRPLAVGHSMGALTLWRYIMNEGCGRLGAVCILDQSPKLVTDADWELGIYGDFSADRDSAFQKLLWADFPQAVLKLAADGLNERARRLIEQNSDGIQRLRDRLSRLDPAPLIAIWRSLTATDFRPALARIDVPALLVYGAASNFYSQAVADYVHAAVAGSTLAVYDGADHSPHHCDRPRFLADLADLADRARLSFVE